MRIYILICLIYLTTACTCWPTNATKVETVTTSTKYWGTRVDLPPCASVCATLCDGPCADSTLQNFTHTITFFANAHQFSLCETSTRALVSLNACSLDVLSSLGDRVADLDAPQCEIEGVLYAVSSAAAALLFVGLCGFCACTYSCLRTFCKRRPKPQIDEPKLDSV
jgi:hypothetical protein